MVIRDIHPHVADDGTPVPYILGVGRLRWLSSHEDLLTSKDIAVATRMAQTFFNVNNLTANQKIAGYHLYILYGYRPPIG